MEFQFPIEIWEQILCCLPSRNLLRAACVCRQWRHLASRVCRLRCQSLPPRLLAELSCECSTALPAHLGPPDSLPKPLEPAHHSFNPAQNTPSSANTQSEVNSLSAGYQITNDVPNNGHIKFPSTGEYMQHRVAHSHSPTPPSNSEDMEANLSENGCERGDPDWLQMTRMVTQTHLTTTPSDCTIISQVNGVSLLASSSEFLVLVEKPGGQSIIKLWGGPGRECHYTFDKTINKVCVMEGEGGPPVLAVCVEKELQCLMVDEDLGGLTPIPCSPALSVDSRLCCDGRMLVVSQLTKEYHLSVYQAEFQGGGSSSSLGMQIQFSLLGRITTSSPPLSWDLWNGFVTTLVSGGHVSCHTLSGALVGESPLYKDLRYPNPTLLSRGLVLASTITSRALLSYWHMDRDRDYWLMGESVLTAWVQRGVGSIGNASRITDTRNSSSGGGARDGVGEDNRGKENNDNSPSSPRSYMEPNSSCILTLNKVRVGAAVLEEVTVCHYRRGLVYCGTNQGRLLVYKIQDELSRTVLNNNNNQTNGGGKSADQAGSSSGERINWRIMECCQPSLFLTLAQRPIARLNSHFTKAGVVVAVVDRGGNCYVVTIPYTGPSQSLVHYPSSCNVEP